MSMDLPKEVILLDGMNYPYWKAKMRAILKSIDERVWQAVINGWKPPIVIISEVTIPKDISVWDIVDYENYRWNRKTINAIFNGVTIEEFRRISHCKLTKEALDILQFTHESTTTLKIAKFQRLPTTFETLRMEDEYLINFIVNLVISSTQVSTLVNKSLL